MTNNEKHIVQTKEIACAGTNQALGHPRVFLNMGTKNEIICPYCSAHYVLDENAPEQHNSH